jgi:uncharacterized protein
MAWTLLDVSKRIVYFFEEPGEKNTDDVVNVISDRAKDGDIEAVVVASVSGGMAVKVAESLKALALETKVVCVTGPPSWQKDAPQYQFPLVAEKERKKLRSLHVELVDQINEPFKPIVFRDWWKKKTLTVPLPESDLFWMTLICVGGHGLRTAVEVTFMAVEAGSVRTGQRVIGVAGTNRGLDSAIVLKATKFDYAVGRRPSKRMKVEEILAMPKQTSWKGYG